MTEALDRTIETLTRRLLAERLPAGHWEGRLATSALSTATAVMALAVEARVSADISHRPLVRGGFCWLVTHQNADGGWGDTPESVSNLSTTALCWSALTFDEGPSAATRSAVARAEGWLRETVGELRPGSLKAAIIARYGRDKTFSVPILSVLALAGKLGQGASAWRLVPQLPFELAACPHRWFQLLRLPVVSYALPALVAIGQMRHHHAPSRNPVAAAMRSRLRDRTLRVARQMQPASGGYLEAVPLTAFVVMSLVSAGASREAIVANGVRFLAVSARPDGGWPIDTNLATWVTTLSVDALSFVTPARDGLNHGDREGPGGSALGAAGNPRRVPGPKNPRPDRDGLLRWLLAQQVHDEHPFTHAAPGGWAWTDLSGGVPDADDTAGALRAIWTLTAGAHGAGPPGPAEVRAAVAGLNWLLELQNPDGGVPTFCRGWGALPFDRSAPDLTAHALDAWSAWHGVVAPDLRRRLERAADRAVSYLIREQGADGGWAPLWFGNQHTPDERNLTFGTARVLRALATPLARRSTVAVASWRRAVAWLVAAQNSDGGWGGGPSIPSSIEETGVALHALASAVTHDLSTAGSREDRSRGRAEPWDRETVGPCLVAGTRWLIDATEQGQRTPASPIGLYFARLWYDEALYPIIFALRGLAAARAAAGIV